ncbi:DUF202 domain-containing protein [Sinomonas sp. ASV322]|uniref:DUF202 domain-containing protein n=1 Tax=Sinomonas sp. ASV322 TaxID=3041920 RepID=UPI0027DCD777|nr:DUF202 domain-containing protein [Sinomonas sp. ASV322]MDQ4504473.1 DUF202 domain-containing protein [Sinomonas sp. ASV322]
MTPETRAHDGDRDPGLQPERTSLAWGRTLLALLVSDLLIWRSWAHSLNRHEGSIEGSTDALGIAAAVAAAATAVIALCVLYRGRALRRGHAAPSPALMRTATLSLLALAAATTVSILLTK